MRFTRPLVRGVLVRRYNRFLAEVDLGGETVTAHCPNPGSMMGLAAPGTAVLLEPNDDPRRKLRWGWRLVDLGDGEWAGIDTATPNRIVAESLAAGAIPALAAYPVIRPEVRAGPGSRIDFRLSGPGLPDAWVEVKNVHLRREGDWAEFPDCVTARGAKHLDLLGDLAESGDRAVMLYVVQRTDCRRMRFAADLDAAYAAAFARARARGVEALVHACAIDPGGVTLAGPLPLSA